MAEADTYQEEEALGKAYDARLMRRLIQYLMPYKWHVALAIFILVLASAAAIVGPWLTQIVIDEAIPQRDTRLLALVVSGYIAAVVIGFVLHYAQAVTNDLAGTVRDVRPAHGDLREAPACRPQVL